MRILLATDGSEHSEAALDALLSRPWPTGARVKVISVVPHLRVPPPPAPAWNVDVGPRVSEEEHLRAHAALNVERAADRLRERGFEPEILVRTGNPGAEIVAAADEWNADLIFVGSRGLTGIKRLLVGSVAQWVVAHAHCSVEVVHAKQAAEAPSARTSSAPG